MNKYIASVLITLSGGLITTAHAQGVDYTNRSFTENSCELFARDAHQAAGKFSQGSALAYLLNLIDAAPVPDSEKQRTFQAIQFVWKNRLDNPTLAYTLAMGLCLEPKHNMAPMDEPWLISPRTSREFY